MDIEKKFSTCGPYKILKTLGRGSYGLVKLAELDGSLYALKLFPITSHYNINQAVVQELRVLEQTHHSNLVGFVNFHNKITYNKKSGEKVDKMCLVIEYVAGGELFQFVAETGRFKEEVCRFYFLQLLQALLYLHNKGIAHRDIKLENCLLDDKFNLKVADFSFATNLCGKSGTGLLMTSLGTKGYQAPEILANQPYNGQSIDLFAAAVILFIMYMGFTPFQQAKPTDPFYKLICLNKHEEFWAYKCQNMSVTKNPIAISEEFKSLLSCMLAYDPTQRPSISEILMHAWMQGPIASHEQVLAEFQLRKSNTDAQLEKKKLQKLALKQQKESEQPQQQKILHTGIGKWRSLEESDITLVDQIYQLNEGKRELKEYDYTCRRLGDFFTTLEPEYLLRTLLFNYKKFCNEVLEVSPKRYKFKIRQVDENNEALTIEIELRGTEDDLVNVNFIRSEGSCIEFFKKVKQIEDFIECEN